MSSTSLPRIATSELRADASIEDRAVRVILSGSAESSAKEALDGLLRALHVEALGQGLREVVVDVRDLEFMNSSCFKSFVFWLREAQEVDPAKQYKIRLLSDDAKHWQRRSLAALACFAADLVHIEV
jgi:hypothetical protein